MLGHNKKSIGNIARLMKYIRPYLFLFIIALIVVTISTYISMLPPQIIRNAINNYILNTSISEEVRIYQAGKSGLIYLLVNAFIFILGYISLYITAYIGGKIVYDIRQELFSHTMKLPLSFMDKNPTGRITTRIANDTENMQDFFTSVITDMIQDIFLLFGVVFVMYRMSPALFKSVFFIFPLIVIAIIIFRYYDLKVYRIVRTNLARINAFLAEHISGMPVIKLFNAEKYKYNEFDEINKDHYKSSMSQLYVFAIFRPIILAIAAIVWSGARYILNKTLNFGDLYAFVAYLDLFIKPLRDISEKYDIIQNTVASSEKVFRILDEKEEDIGNRNGLVKVENGDIRFRNVWFRYNEDRWILKGINLDFEPGQLTAIVGETGAGKTSLMNLVNGMYRAQQGDILVDGHKLEEYNINELRKQVSTVPQDVILFSGTLLDNIRLFDSRISEQQVVSALKRVYAYDAINKLPGGIYTTVVERGKGISAGERQLVALARAVLFDAKVLILDEATSNIDVETESRIQLAVNELAKERNIIMIAHRLTTVINAKRIIVIHKGVVAEEGTHAELMKKNGIYHKLYELQFS